MNSYIFAKVLIQILINVGDGRYHKRTLAVRVHDFCSTCTVEDIKRWAEREVNRFRADNNHIVNSEVRGTLIVSEIINP